jgi:DinB superfamily
MEGSYSESDLAALQEAFDAIERDARELTAGLSPLEGSWRPSPSAWSVAECLDHLATANRVYLAAMRPPAERALAGGKLRRRPAVPGLIGGWFVRTLEPPAGTRMKAPRKIVPRTAPPFADASTAFFTSHEDARTFLRTYAGIDLAGVRFPNPFIRGVRFSLATGIHVIAAHERRHLWQAREVLKAASARRLEQAS